VTKDVPSLKWAVVIALGLALFNPQFTNAATKAAGEPPVIDEQPIGRVATAGGHVVLSVLAHATAPMTFQWFTNNHTQPITNSARITGATNAVLNIDPALTSDSGGYSVVVTANGASVTSSVANVVVNALNVQATQTGATGVVVVLTGQIGDVYRMELNENFAGYRTNGYATNVTGSVSYTYRWPTNTATRFRRETVDRVLPVLYRPTAQAPTSLRAYGKLNQIWRFEGSTDLQTWAPITTVTNTRGWYQFNDVPLQPPPIRFYRIGPS
jgi:hypothetical protein